MLQIDVIGFSGEELIFEVNGNPNGGNSTAKKNEQVHWKVKNDSGVKAIAEISPKLIGGSTNIFSNDPPKAQNQNRTHWKAKVNNNVSDYAVYIYKIKWIKDDNTEHTADPIIAIRPTRSIPREILIPAATLVFGAITSFLYWRMERMKLKKEIERLKGNKA